MTTDATSYIQGVIWDPPLEEHLAQLVEVEISARRAIGSVVPVNDASSIIETRASLNEVEDDEWDWDEWLHRGTASPGCPVIGVRDQSAAKIVGFCAIETNACVERNPSGGVVDLNFEIAAVYVRPEYRGRGFGAILRQAAATYLRSLIDAIAALPPADIADLEMSGLSVTVHAHPESQEGHAFANGVSGDVELHLSALASRAWFAQAAFIDETDPEEEPSMP